ncbi:MAG: ATP-binding protein [Marmoricola sp.]
MYQDLQPLLFALLGALVGGGAVLAWRISEIQQDRARPADQPVLPTGVAAVLSVLRSSALVVDVNDVVLKATAPTYTMNLVRGDRIVVPELAALISQVRRDGQIRETELVVPRPGTPARHVTARIAPLGADLVLALVEDRTRERQVEEIRRDFVANVSHELKTPVGAIKLLSEAVGEASDDPEAVQRFAGRMSAESDRLGRLVQQIIELSRLQHDTPVDEAGLVDLDWIVERVIDENATDAAARHISVVRDGDKGIFVHGEAEQLALAVGNLVSNAIAYSSQGTSVVIGTQQHPEYVDIAVSDQGIGIPADELNRIFERFYRVDPARHRSTGGTGLGLSIVKHVAATHGGDVNVWSEEGHGSTFTLRLPTPQYTDENPEEQEEGPR